MTGVVEHPAPGALEDVCYFFPVDAKFRWSVYVGLAAFDFNEMDHIGFGGDDVYLVATMPPVAGENMVAVGNQPVSGECFSLPSGLDMWHHPCNL